MRKDLFNTNPVPVADTINTAGGVAYKKEDKDSLVSYALTGFMGDTFYASVDSQVDEMLNLMRKVNDNVFLAKLAVYARENGYMKDMPSYILAYLHSINAPQVSLIFNRVIDNAKMLRNFMQIVRSGKLGRKSFGTRTKKLIQNWLNTCDDYKLLNSTVGNDPTLKDIIKMVHPKSNTEERSEFYKWILGKEFNYFKLPALLKAFEDFKKNPSEVAVPKIEFRLLSGMTLPDSVWKEIAKNAPWQMARMNLNTFSRHNVFKDKEMVKLISDKLSNKELVKKARVFPYQLLAAYNATEDVPAKVKEALQDAMEIAVENVPLIDGKVVILPDVSGSMSMNVTGGRGSASSQVRCIDVAALVSAAFLRVNKEALVIPFENDIVSMDINPRDSIMTIARQIGSIGGGGTAVSAPLVHMNANKVGADLVIYISDNESWADMREDGRSGAMVAWRKFKKANPKAKCVCIDICPSSHSQLKSKKGDDILYIGGFSDNVFSIIKDFYTGDLDSSKMVGLIESVNL